MNLLINKLTPELTDLIKYKRLTPATSKQTCHLDNTIAVEKIEQMLSTLDPDMDYESWLKVGMALHSHGCDLGVWDDWSAQGEKYEPDMCADKWDGFSPGGDVTIGTLIYMAKEVDHQKNNTLNDDAFEKPSKLIPWSQLSSLPKRSHLVKGLIDEGAFSMVYGASNSGKTFYALDLACHVALGWKWCGKDTKQGSVVYVAGEGGLGIFERLEAFKAHYGLDEGRNLSVWPQPLNLGGDSVGLESFLEEIKEYPDIKLIVVDTVARSLGNADENSSSAMGAFVQNCDLIRVETQAHVMVIHHTGKDATKGARGSSALKAAVDTEIEVAQKSGAIDAKVTKQRDGKTGGKLHFKLQACSLGKDEDGDAISSCVMQSTEAPVQSNSLPPQAYQALGILQSLTKDRDIISSFSNDTEVNLKIPLDEFKERCREESLSSNNADSFNKAFKRARDILKTQGYTEETKDSIILKDKADKDGLVL